MFLSVSEKNELLKVYESLRKAAESDIFYNKVQHNSGWGCFIANKQESILYKTLTPIYKDKEILNALKDNQHALKDNQLYYSIFHARLAGENQPTRGFVDSHPYVIYTDDSLIALAHNGSIEKNAVSKELNLRPELYTDTEILALLFKKFQEYDIEKALGEVNKYIKDIGAFNGTFNVIAIKIKRQESTISLSSACVSDYPNEENKKYRTMILFNNGKTFLAMSSTVAYYYGIIDENLELKNTNSKICDIGKVYSSNILLSKA
jgi:glutamine amidotransferase